MSFIKIKSKKEKNRFNLKKRNRANRNRLTVFCSNNHIHAQLIDDINSVTLAAASSCEKDFKSGSSKSANIKCARDVANRVAQRIKDNKLSSDIVFDRGDKIYHGKIKAFAEAMRENGFNC